MLATNATFNQNIEKGTNNNNNNIETTLKSQNSILVFVFIFIWMSILWIICRRISLEKFHKWVIENKLEMSW